MAICSKCQREAPPGALFCSFCGGAIRPSAGSAGAADPLIGTTLSGKYFISQLLGSGGMGDVYKATHLTLDRPVVVKLLRKSFLSDPSLVQRFHREARAASRLNHPNSITIIDFGQTEDGTLFMAMEYLAGRSLARVISEDWPLSERRVVHIGEQILAALAEAHALGIIHRDLKPANVILEARRNDPDFVKVLDFGIAKLNEPGEAGEAGGRLTQAGMVCGTPGYMSPEQVRGEVLDARADLYSVGVILYELLTGLLPFEADTPMGLFTKHLAEQVPAMALRRAGLAVSAGLDALVMRSLAKERADRPATADEMRDALLACEVREGPPAVEPPPPPHQATVIFDASALPTPASAQRTPPTPGGQGHPPTPRTPDPAARTSHPAQVQLPRQTPSSQARQAPRAAPARPDRTPVRSGEDAEREEVPSFAARRRLPLLVGAGAAALVILGLAVWGLVRTPAPPPPAPAQVAALPAVPPSAAAPPEAEPPPAPPPSADRPEATPAAGPGPDEAPPPEKKTVKPLPAPPPPPPRKGIRLVRPSLNAIPTPPAASGDGVLSVDANPWAVLYVDGKEIGETPRELRLGAGVYRIRATHPQFEAVEESVTVVAGKRRPLTVTFRR